MLDRRGGYEYEDLLACGRGDAPDDVVISGDHQLGQRVLDSMGILP